MIAAYADGRYEDARSAGNTIRALTPPPSVKWLGYNEIWLGVTYQKMGDIERAVNAFTQAIPYLGQATNETSGQTKANVISYLGRAYRGLSEDWNTITPRQERLEEFAPKGIKHYRSSAQVLRGENRRRDLEDAAKLAERMVAYAREHHDAGRLQDALRVLEKLLAVDSQNTTALALKQQIEQAAAARASEESLDSIRSLLENGSYADALGAVDAALERWPNDEDLVTVRTRALIGLNRPEDALIEVERLQRAGALSPEMALLKAEALFMLERWDEAIVACDGLIREPATSLQARQQAEDLQRRARQQRDRPPDYGDARADIEQMLEQERYMEAALRAEALVQLYPDRPEAACLAAIAYARRSDTAKARAQIESALRRREQLLAETERAAEVFEVVEWALVVFAPANDDVTGLATAVCGWLLLGDGARAGAECDRLDGRQQWNVDRQLLALLHMLWGAAQYVAGVESPPDAGVDVPHREMGPDFHFTRAQALERDAVGEGEQTISAQIERLKAKIGLNLTTP